MIEPNWRASLDYSENVKSSSEGVCDMPEKQRNSLNWNISNEVWCLLCRGMIQRIKSSVTINSRTTSSSTKSTHTHTHTVIVSYPNNTHFKCISVNDKRLRVVSGSTQWMLPPLHQPLLPVPSRASPPPPRGGSGVWTGAHGSGGGSSTSRFSPV